jgi:hypothetical protein
MAAKEKWVGGDVPGAQAILAEAFKQNEDSESIFASETNEMEAAQQILLKARAQAGTERVGTVFQCLVYLLTMVSDLDEVRGPRTPTRSARRGAQDARTGYCEIPQLRQAAHDPRTDLRVPQRGPSGETGVRSGLQGVFEEHPALDPFGPAGGKGWRDDQGEKSVGEGEAVQSQKRRVVGGEHQDRRKSGRNAASKVTSCER